MKTILFIPLLFLFSCHSKYNPIVIAEPVHLLNQNILNGTVRLQHCTGKNLPGAPDSINLYTITYVYDEVIEDNFPANIEHISGSTPSPKSIKVFNLDFGAGDLGDSLTDNKPAFDRIIKYIQEHKEVYPNIRIPQGRYPIEAPVIIPKGFNPIFKKL